MTKRRETRGRAEEGTAEAGAKAEGQKRPLSWNPHKRNGPLQRAWAIGWKMGRADRLTAEAEKRATERR